MVARAAVTGCIRFNVEAANVGGCHVFFSVDLFFY